MECVNKSLPQFKKLADSFGEELAEKLVIGYSRNVKKLQEGFVYPSTKEVSNWVTSSKKEIVPNLTKALRINPNLSEKGILKFLSGVIKKYSGAIFITSGAPANFITLKEEVKNNFYLPNLAIMKEMEKRFPDIFKVESTSKEYTKIVKITPRKQAPPTYTQQTLDLGAVVEKEVSTTTFKDSVGDKFTEGNVQKSSVILEKIANSNHPYAKVAKQLLKYVSINDVDIIIEDVEDYDLGEVKGATAYYSPKENHIKLAGNQLIRKLRGDSIILHEILHALSYQALRQNSNALNEFKKLYQISLDKLGKYDPSLREGYYANYTLDEFFVALFTDQKFIKKLSEIPAERSGFKNMFEDLMDYLLNLLGIRKGTSVYTEALTIASNILEERKDYIDSITEEYEYTDELVGAVEEPVKPGVEELFDSNPELANAVYEALGFKTITYIPNYEVVTRPTKDIGKSKGRTGNFVEITTPDNYRTNMSAYMVQTNNDGKLFITNIEKYNEDSTFKGFGTVAYVDFFENYKNQEITTDKKLTADGIKLLERLEKIGLVYKTNAKLIDDTQVSKVYNTKIYEYDKPLYEFNLNWSRTQITPQQKQQAQQLYSQYLDTIFPDSKVKDIVYHGSPVKGLQEIKRGTDNQGKMYTSKYGITFTNNDLTASIYAGQISLDPNVEDNLDSGQVYPALLNLKNFTTQDFNNESYGGKFGSAISTYNNALEKAKKENKDGFIATNIADPVQNQTNYVVFEPEQIHILGNEQDVEGFKEFVAQKGSQPMMQLEGTEVGTASPKTLAMIKDFLRRVGVDIKVLQKVVVNGKPIGANGAAFLMQKLVQVAEGKEAQALPEEAMHFAVAIIKQTDPALYKKLLSEINNYRILKDVFATYSSDPNYQTKEGKPDVAKLKEEAIGKLLTQIILQKGDAMMETAENVAKAQSWWQRIIQAIKNLIPKSGFDRLVMDIVSGKNIGTAKDIREEQDAVMLQKDPQQAIFDKLKEVSSKISKKDEKYQIDGKVINRRVTDLIKDWYSRRFNNKDLVKSEYQTAVDDLKREKGTAGHADFEKAFEVFVDENGFLRDTPLDDSTYTSQINPNNRDMYELLKENMRIRLNSFPKGKGKGTRFLKEITVYDPNRSLAGTIDFLAITPEGKVSILDWKFMNLNIEKYEMEGKIPDVPWYKVSAWRQQMEQYKLILQNVYGVDPQNFEQTRMIPIQATYSKGDVKANILPELLSIKIGDVEVKNIKEDYLIPVGLEEEKTGNKKIDTLIEKLNAVYKLLSEKKVTPDQKREKAEQLNSLFYAIRQLQMKQNIKPLIDQATILNKEIQKTIQMYDVKFKGKDPNTFSEKEIDEFAEELQNAQDTIKTYVDLDATLRSLFQGDTSEEAKQLKSELRDVSDDARDISLTLDEMLNDFTSEVIAKRERIKNLLSPEKVVRGITRLFASTSTIQLNAMHVLYRKANKAFTYAGYDTNTENNRLVELKAAYDKWASSKGLNKKNYFSYIKKKNNNELIDEFNPEFYSQLKKKIEEKDTQWIIDNINVREFNEELKKQLEKEFEYIENKSRAGTEDQIEAAIRIEKAKARQLYDTSTLESPGWLMYDYVKKFPKRDKWESKEWKELNKPENKPALDFYNYIKERNEVYRDLGYINRADARTFLPYVEKGLVEKLIVGGNVKLGEQFFRGISIDSRDTGYGRINPLDGKPVDAIPKYFTEEIEGEVSEDLFRTMALYNEAAIRYKYVSEIENQVRALVRVERNKKAIATSRFGKTVMKDGVLQYNPNNDQNAQLVEDMMKAIVYGQRYLESETFDQLLGKIGNWGEKINEKLGMKVFPENLSDKQVSVNKIIDNLNNSFQISTLGLNVLSASSNFFGGTAQSLINAGKYFTKTDFIKAETSLFVDKLNALGTREEKKKLLAALEYFLPLTENYNREVANKLSIAKLNDQSIQDFLMILMRKGDLAVQTANFYAFLNNTIVENGQVVNVREYLRNQPKYKDKYGKTVEDRKRLDEEFENDVKKLMDEKGVLKTAKLVDNKLVIPGVERKSESVVQLRRNVQQMSKDALGNLTEDDLRKINMNIYGKSFMVFKNWIPRQIDVRMGNIKYNSAAEAYEWGRMRTVFSVMSQDWFRLAGNLRNSLIANEKGVEFLRELFEKKKLDYKNDTGKELDMTEDEFMNLVRQNIRNQMYDLILLTTMILLVAALKANMPDDEEDPAVKAQYRFIVKAADKFKDELMYFYDPTSFQNLISKGIFPSISLLDNMKKAMTNFFVENWALATGDEETVEDTKVIKYWMKTFPVTNQMAGYLPMFFPELAKDLGLKVQSNYGIR